MRLHITAVDDNGKEVLTRDFYDTIYSDANLMEFVDEARILDDEMNPPIEVDWEQVRKESIEADYDGDEMDEENPHDETEQYQ